MIKPVNSRPSSSSNIAVITPRTSGGTGYGWGPARSMNARAGRYFSLQPPFSRGASKPLCDPALTVSTRAPQRCPCGSGESYADCCGALHRGRAALTAERLMRSRFSAFAVGDAPYLLATWHPSTRPASLELDPDLEWQRLEILQVTAGAEGGTEGTVAFDAHYWDNARRERGLQREHSAFRRDAGRWFYVGPVPEMARH